MQLQLICDVELLCIVYVISRYILRVVVVIQGSVFHFYVTFGLLCISNGCRCRFTYAEAERET